MKTVRRSIKRRTPRPSVDRTTPASPSVTALLNKLARASARLEKARPKR